MIPRESPITFRSLDARAQVDMNHPGFRALPVMCDRPVGRHGLMPVRHAGADDHNDIVVLTDFLPAARSHDGPKAGRAVQGFTTHLTKPLPTSRLWLGTPLRCNKPKQLALTS